MNVLDPNDFKPGEIGEMLARMPVGSQVLVKHPLGVMLREKTGPCKEQYRLIREGEPLPDVTNTTGGGTP